MASACLAIYRVLKDRGKTAEEVGKIIYEMTEKMVDYPKFILHFVGRLRYGKRYEKKISLTRREKEILQLIAEGFANKEIAAKLNLALNTVRVHRRNIMQKLDIHKHADIVRYAIKEGISKL